MPLVSVLMSNYKTPVLYLKGAIDSILNQTLQDFEIVIINDGIKDESFTLIQQYASRDQRIRVIENESNIRLAASLNRGIDACEGKYIARMDTDDICYPDRLEKQVAFMNDNPDLLFSGAWADVFYDDTAIVKKQWRPQMCSWDEYKIRLLFADDPLLIHPTVIFNRELLEAHHLRYDTDEKYKYSEDYRMWVKCAACGRAGILETPVIKYRDSNSDSRITIRHAQEMEHCVYQVQKEQFKELGIDLTEDLFKINHWLLSGRKPYDVRYKRWMKLIIKRNDVSELYNPVVLKRLFSERWYSIVYYGIAYEKSWGKRLSYFLTLNTLEKMRFIRSLKK